MPFYSESTKTITFRIVYDGLGTAGKTTNVQQLHELYAMRRESDVIVPEVVRGRTAYFDWLELATGTLDDRYALRCQVVTVPGQFAYAPRRWKLLKEPDAVVCVCDSSTGGVRRARLGLDFLRELRARGVCPDVPFVIQANKRDLSDAVPIVDLRAALGLDPEETVTEAVASTGEGVQLTFYRVLDRARAHLRDILAHRDPATFAAPETPDDLLATLRDELEGAADEAYEVVDAIASADRER